MRRPFRDWLLVTLIPPLASLFIRALGTTLRIRFLNPELEKEIKANGKHVIYVFWHSGILVACYARRGLGITTLVSQHRDGELIARTAKFLGFRSARGSSTRGGAAGLKALCDAAQSNQGDLSINPDGPRGPAKQVQPGAIALSSLTGLPILPATMAYSSAWRLRSWDRFVVPKPFSRVYIQFGKPLEVPADLPKERYAEYQEQLRLEMEAAEEAALAALEGTKA